jgi:predicted DNA-binding transcriptional regulator YafY
MPKSASGQALRQMTTRVPVHRMMLIHERINEGRFVNCSDLARELEVNRKTIQRDIQCMRLDMDLPIEYDETRHGYYYDGAVGDLPLFKVTEGELLALFIAEKALAPLEGTPFARKIQSGLRKLSSALPESIGVSWQELDQAFSFRQTGVAKADTEVFDKLASAVQRRKEINFEYKKLGAEQHELRCVWPYQVLQIDGQWYLFAHDLERKALRKFVLTRIQKVTVMRRGFKRPDDFSVVDQLKDSFGIFSSGTKTFRIKLHFDTFAAQLIQEREWHASQKLRDLPKGELEMTMSLGSLEEVERWVLSWGSHVRVLGPKQLVTMIRDTTAKMAANY